MKNELILFSVAQGNLLIRLLLAHIISDFILQTDKMVKSKKWLSLYMLVPAPGAWHALALALFEGHDQAFRQLLCGRLLVG